MKSKTLSVAKSNKADTKISTLVAFVAQTKGRDKDKIQVSTSGLSKDLAKLASGAESDSAIKAGANECRLFRNADIEGFQNILFVGLGEQKSVCLETARKAGAAANASLKAQGIDSFSVHYDSLACYAKPSNDALQALVEGIQLGDYDFAAYKSKEKKEKDTKASVQILNFGSTNTATLKKAVDTGVTLAESVNFSRILGDTPGNLMTPSILAKSVQDAAKGTKLKITVWDKARIKKEKMGGLYGVSLGSDVDPRFIIMEYKGAAASKKPLVFVGKGLTFDSGGISIKPSASMDEMKYDMCGGANVIGAMIAIAKLKLKVNVTAYIPSTENMPGPLANKPGDILTARNGKTVEVLNTDAEGRLILMDALSYATEQKPAAIIDAATLTGAMVMALGNSYTGVFTNNNALLKKVNKAADKSGEKVWNLPIDEDHVKDMEGKHADLSNIASFRGAGSSTAAAFLMQFVDKDIPWAHFDIAGTAWNTSNRLNYCPKKGASGSMIRTFVELAKQY